MDHFTFGLYFFELFINFVINILSDIKPVMNFLPLWGLSLYVECFFSHAEAEFC